MDGFAVRFHSVRGAREFRLRSGLVGRAVRGPRLRPGEAVAITTGTPLPPGAQAVVRREFARAEGENLTVRRPIRPGADVHARGEDLSRGSVLLRAGETVRPYHVAPLLGQRIDRLFVRRVRGTILAIGDEIGRGSRALPGTIPDSLSPLIRALSPEVEWKRIGPLPDRLGEIARALQRASEDSDLLVTIGGTSVGAKDFTKPAVETVGRLLVPGVRVNVLKRGGFGMVGSVPVVLLPGQVVSAVTVWHEYGLRAVARLLGCPPPRGGTVRLRRALENPHPMDSVYLFRVTGGLAEPCRWGVRLHSELLRANAYGIVPRHSSLRAGTPIAVRWLEGGGRIPPAEAGCGSLAGGRS